MCYFRVWGSGFRSPTGKNPYKMSIHQVASATSVGVAVGDSSFGDRSSLKQVSFIDLFFFRRWDGRISVVAFQLAITITVLFLIAPITDSDRIEAYVHCRFVTFFLFEISLSAWQSEWDFCRTECLLKFVWTFGFTISIKRSRRVFELFSVGVLRPFSPHSTRRRFRPILLRQLCSPWLKWSGGFVMTNWKPRLKWNEPTRGRWSDW